MTSESTSLRAAREETIDALCGRFAGDELSLAELERRLEKARGARTRGELRELLADLAPAPAPVVQRGREARSRPARRRDPVPEAARDARPSAGRGTTPV